MKEIVLPLCSFAPVHWVVLIANFPCVIESCEHYPKQTFRNRYEVCGPNGRQTLTVPVVGQKGIKTRVRDIRISGTSWKKNHLGTIASVYGRSAYFEHFYPEMEKIMTEASSFLFDFNLQSLELFMSVFDKKELRLTHTYEEKTEGKDLRSNFEPGSTWPALSAYPQVFSDRFEFQGGLSFLDALFHLGPGASDYATSEFNRTTMKRFIET